MFSLNYTLKLGDKFVWYYSRLKLKMYPPLSIQQIFIPQNKNENHKNLQVSSILPFSFVMTYSWTKKQCSKKFIISSSSSRSRSGDWSPKDCLTSPAEDLLFTSYLLSKTARKLISITLRHGIMTWQWLHIWDGNLQPNKHISCCMLERSDE